MDFSDAEATEAAQVLDVVEGREGVEYQVKWVFALLTWRNADLPRAAKFAGMTSLTVYIPSNNSDGDEDTTRVYYIGLRGKWTAVCQLMRSRRRFS